MTGFTFGWRPVYTQASRLKVGRSLSLPGPDEVPVGAALQRLWAPGLGTGVCGKDSGLRDLGLGPLIHTSLLQGVRPDLRSRWVVSSGMRHEPLSSPLSSPGPSIPSTPLSPSEDYDGRLDSKPLFRPSNPPTPLSRKNTLSKGGLNTDGSWSLTLK